MAFTHSLGWLPTKPSGTTGLTAAGCPEKQSRLPQKTFCRKQSIRDRSSGFASLAAVSINLVHLSCCVFAMFGISSPIVKLNDPRLPWRNGLLNPNAL
jgi:hypothetical protein